jgi:DNA-binding CsgD family transcriptional regulator
MDSSTVERQPAVATVVTVTTETLAVELTDGRAISVPIAWYPRLSHATSEEREDWRLIADGRGIRWPALDEDISIESLLNGKASGESQKSLETWLNRRKEEDVNPA